MRSVLQSLLFLAVVAPSASAQVCKKIPPPFLADLFPATISGLPLEFATAPGAGCMALYRPQGAEARASRPWASVTMDPNPEPGVGETAVDVQSHLSATGDQLMVVDGWPVAFSATAVGDQYITLRGAVRIKVLVKNGDHGDASRALATVFLQKLLAEVPCG